MKVVEGLKPEKVFGFFEEITKIPHGSGNEEELSKFVANFAKERGLKYIRDDANNVVIFKEASKGMENLPTVAIQGHLDMVCEKNSHSDHDFLKDPLELMVEGDFLTAKDTTLGADNGIAVAYALAILDSSDILHPALECIFTTDEEVGMKGAKALDTTNLKSKYFINLDSEEEGHVCVSCAGGLRAEILLPIEHEEKPENATLYEICVKGLKGGHSGADIHLQRPSANVLIGRVLDFLNDDIKLCCIKGGNKDNVISRESKMLVYIDNKNIESVASKLDSLEKIFINEFKDADDGIKLIMTKVDNVDIKPLTKDVMKKVTSALMLLPYGVIRITLSVDNLVETSNNIGIIATEEDHIRITCAVRSSIESLLDDICSKIETLANLIGAKIEVYSRYPGWEFDKNSEILKIVKDCYKEMYGKDAIVEGIHAGLECGLFSKKMPNCQMVSFGPDLFDVHTPEERLSISSVERTWNLLLLILKNIK